MSDQSQEKWGGRQPGDGRPDPAPAPEIPPTSDVDPDSPVVPPAPHEEVVAQEVQPPPAPETVGGPGSDEYPPRGSVPGANAGQLDEPPAEPEDGERTGEPVDGALTEVPAGETVEGDGTGEPLPPAEETPAEPAPETPAEPAQ